MGSMSWSTTAAGFRRGTEQALAPACTRRPAMAAGPVATGHGAHPRAWVQLRKGPAAPRGSKATVRSPTGPHGPAGPTLRPGAPGVLPVTFCLHQEVLTSA